MSGLSGMTGFGRAGDDTSWGSWTWEAKSVNGRGLDVRVNVPAGFEGLDQSVKKLASALFSRGNLQIGLRIELLDTEEVSVNMGALDKLCDAYESRAKTPAEGQALAALMTARGVLEVSGSGSQSLRQLGRNENVRSELLVGAEEALRQLARSRGDEGTALKSVLMAALEEMDTVRQEAESASAEQPVRLKERLIAKLADIASEQSLDAERLMAEAALMAAKSDVREELDRLAAHIETARGHLGSGKPVGRKLDFLAQELNREANTMCAKSASLALTNAGLALKSLIDQVKEQAANVE